MTEDLFEGISPCPFCGNKANYYDTIGFVCAGCSAQFDLKWNEHSLVDRQQARDKWQRRAVTAREEKLAKVLNRTKEVLDRYGHVHKASETYEYIANTLKELGITEERKDG